MESILQHTTVIQCAQVREKNRGAQRQKLEHRRRRCCAAAEPELYREDTYKQITGPCNNSLKLFGARNVFPFSPPYNVLPCFYLFNLNADNLLLLAESLENQQTLQAYPLLGTTHIHIEPRSTDLILHVLCLLLLLCRFSRDIELSSMAILAGAHW
jgi:hypothetical protein